MSDNWNTMVEWYLSPKESRHRNETALLVLFICYHNLPCFAHTILTNTKIISSKDCQQIKPRNMYLKLTTPHLIGLGECKTPTALLRKTRKSSSKKYNVSNSAWLVSLSFRFPTLIIWCVKCPQLCSEKWEKVLPKNIMCLTVHD